MRVSIPTLSGLFARFRQASQNGTRMVYAGERPSIMWKHIYTGAMGSVYFSLLTGIWLVGFGSNIGLQYWHWAAMSAASSFALVLQLVSAYVASHVGARKLMWFVAAMCSRMVRALAIAVAFWLYMSRPGTARALFVALIIVGNVFDALCAPLWWSWFADIIPRRTHGRFAGRRSSWIALANLLVVVPIGIALNVTREELRMPMLIVAFAFGFLVGAVDLLIHRTIPEPPMTETPTGSFWSQVAVPLRDRSFRPWLVFWAAWSFSMALGGSLSQVYFAENLHMKQDLLGGGIALMVLPLIGGMIAAGRLGAMVDRYGIKRMLWWGHRFWALLPLFWLVTTPGNAVWLLGLSSLVAGVSSNTATIAGNKLVSRLKPPGQVPMYVAVSTCVGALAGGFGPMAAAVVLHALEGKSVQAGPFVFVGFHILFLVSLILRNASTLLIRRVQEPGKA